MTGTPVLVFVGGGPRTVSVLERIAANARVLPPPGGLQIHVIDPYPVGGGRIWRRAQSPLLWMNSVARDVTIFPDDSVRMDGPVVPGPSLWEWVSGPGRQVLIDAGLAAQADAFTGDSFASREIQSLYLSWTFDRIRRSLPAGVRLTTHRQSVIAVHDAADGRQQVCLRDGSVVDADMVVLAQGFLDRVPTAAEAALTAHAARAGLTYVPPGYTADVDLSGLRAGTNVLVRGLGLAFIDVLVLVFQDRGGSFEQAADGALTYRPSGAEPVLYVGSRRGVPYHAKLDYPAGATDPGGPVAPIYFTADAVAGLAVPTGFADFRGALWPLIVKELTAAHYRRLFDAHGDRTTRSWGDIAAALDVLDVADPRFERLIRSAVPAAADRFDIDRIDRPLQGVSFAGPQELGRAMVEYISADLERRADPAHSADLAVFHALLAVYGVLAGAVLAGLVSPADRVRYVEGEFQGLFSFLASGPPPRRLREMLALHRAGFLHFVGPDMQVAAADRSFLGWSPAVGGTVRTQVLLDARLPRPDVRAASDPVISGLLAAGELAAEDLTGPDGARLGGGQLLADGRCRAIRADRSVHPRRFLLGPSVSGSAGSAGFARPGYNAPGLRQNDRVARELLSLCRESASSPAARDTTASTRRDARSPLSEVSHAGRG